MNVATKEYVDQIKDSISLQLEDLVSYGVAIDWNNSSPELQRIGNMQLHKTLPIQSGMKGAVVDCLNKRVAYWLDENDWRFKKDAVETAIYSTETILESIAANTEGSIILQGNSNISFLFPRGDKYSGYVKINGIKCKVNGIVSSFNVNAEEYISSITLVPEADLQIEDNKFILEIGAFLDGYDGEVMVYVPEFWIKSYIGEDDKGWVKIATQYIDETWEHQPASFIGAYRDTVLSTNVSESDYRYLGKLPPNSAVSVANFATEFSGGGYNIPSTEVLLKGGKGKCKTSVPRETFRVYERNAGKEILNYSQYKNILYWLYVIEYANFNVQAKYNPTLTPEGFHQGGLGPGLTTVSNWDKFNNYNPIVPNGYTNNIGNGTGIKLVEGDGRDALQPSTPIYSVRWRGIEDPFGHVWHNIDGIIIVADYDANPEGKAHVYITNDSAYYGEPVDSGYYTLAGLQVYSIVARTKKLTIGNNAHIIPAALGGSDTTYVCDYSSSGDKDGSCRMLLLGGTASHGSDAGLSCFSSVNKVTGLGTNIGFRSILVL